jgi:small-conductance mechanosensitive channel
MFPQFNVNAVHGYTFLGQPLEDWICALLIAVVGYFVVLGIWSLLMKRLVAISKRTTTKIDDMICEVLQETHKLTFVVLALLLGLYFLDLPQKWQARLDHVLFIFIGIQFALWLNKAVTLWSDARLTETEGTFRNVIVTSMLSWIFKFVIWCVVLLTILANVGVNITAFVTSLGIGGVAVALALQSILGDVFASLVIGLDKPFVIGDAVAFGTISGSIEHVGLKTTRIRSTDGEQIICSNSDMLKNVIHNYKRMPERRVQFNFGVSYATPHDAVAKIPQIVRKAIESLDKTRFDRAHFKEFGASALNFEVVYFVVNSDYNLYMDIQQAINLYLMKELEALHVQFSFPTMTLNLPPDAAQTELLPGKPNLKAKAMRIPEEDRPAVIK